MKEPFLHDRETNNYAKYRFYFYFVPKDSFGAKAAINVLPFPSDNYRKVFNAAKSENLPLRVRLFAEVLRFMWHNKNVFFTKKIILNGFTKMLMYLLLKFLPDTSLFIKGCAFNAIIIGFSLLTYIRLRHAALAEHTFAFTALVGQGKKYVLPF